MRLFKRKPVLTYSQTEAGKMENKRLQELEDKRVDDIIESAAQRHFIDWKINQHGGIQVWNPTYGSCLYKISCEETARHKNTKLINDKIEERLEELKKQYEKI